MMKKILLLLLITSLTSCVEQADRDCSDFKNGTFEYTYMDGEKELKATFVRKDSIEIDYFPDGRIDTIRVKWINDCEFISRNLTPKRLSDKKAVHFKILSTTEDSYTFEFSNVIKESKSDYVKSRGTVYKIKN